MMGTHLVVYNNYLTLVMNPRFPRIEEPIDKFLNGDAHRPKVRRLKWQSGAELLFVEPPVLIPHQKSDTIILPRRKYASVHFKYKVGGMTKWKTVLFGDADG